MITPYAPKTPVEPYRPPVLDIETEPEQGREIAVGFAWDSETGVRHYHAGPDWAAFFDYFTATYKATSKGDRARLRRIFAHNGGGFDWLHLYRWLMDRGHVVTLKSFQSGNSIVGLNVAMRIAGDRFTLRLRDSFRLMPASLAKIGATFGCATRKHDLGGELPHITLARDPDAFWAYLRADCESLQDALLAFWRLIVDHAGNIGDLPLTLPALSMRLWRMSLSKPIPTTWNADVKALEHAAYTGGRTECLHAGEFDVAVWDVNSEYPAVMAAGVYPISYRGAWIDHYRGEHGVYRVRFEQTNRDRLPVLGVLDERQHRMIYAYEGIGVYTQPELELLFAVGGRIVEFIEGWEYHDVGNPFTAFVEKWYGLRQQSTDDGLRYICKILLNSLYGKFGQEEIGWNVEVWNRDQYVRALDRGTVFKDLGECVLVESERQSEHTFFGVAAYVTAQARCLLYSYAMQAENAGLTVVYMDTDSVHAAGPFAESTGVDSVPTGPGLGELKLEYTGAAIYAGRKLYRKIDANENKAKGVGKHAAAQLTTEDYRRMLRDGVPVSFETFPTPLEVFTNTRKPAIPFRRTRTLRATTVETVETCAKMRAIERRASDVQCVASSARDIGSTGQTPGADG